MSPIRWLPDCKELQNGNEESSPARTPRFNIAAGYALPDPEPWPRSLNPASHHRIIAEEQPVIFLCQALEFLVDAHLSLVALDRTPHALPVISRVNPRRDRLGFGEAGADWVRPWTAAHRIGPCR